MDIFAAVIESIYLHTTASEKHYIICGAEFPREILEKYTAIRLALYGVKLSGSDHWKSIRTRIDHI